MARRAPVDGETQCPLCAGTMAPGSSLCRFCRPSVGEAIGAYWWREPTPYGAAPNLLDELETTITRQARMAAASDGSRATSRPLPYETRAADAYESDARWLRDQARTAGAPALVTKTARPVVAAHWLWAHLDDALAGPDGAELAEQILHRYGRALVAIDRPPESWFAGRCQCGADLYASDAAPMIQCVDCRAVYDVAEQRARLLAGVEDVLATATEICRAVGLLDRPVTRSQVDNWYARGQLVRRGNNPAGHHLYRVGDVLDLLARVSEPARRRTSRA